MTSRSLRTGLPWLALALLGAAMALLTVSPVINPPKWDEFIVIYDAHRVATGQVPYRDFFNFIPPGIFIVLAGFSKAVGGTTLTLGRYAALAVAVATALLAAWALRRRGWGSWAACAVAGIFPLCIYPFWAVWSHQWLANLCLIALLAWFAGGPAGMMKWLVAGLLAGLALLCLQAQGLEALILCAVFILTEREGGAWGRIGGTALGGLLVWGPFAGFLALAGAWSPFFQDTWTWASENYSRQGNENSGPLLQDLGWRLGDILQRFSAGTLPGTGVTVLAGITLYLSLLGAMVLLVALAVMGLVRILKAHQIEGPWLAAAVLLTFLEAGLVLRGNPNWLHCLFALFPLMVLWAGTKQDLKLSIPGGLKRAGTWILAVCLIAGMAYHARGLWRHCPQPWELTDVDRPIREQPINRFLRGPAGLKPGDTLAAFPEGGEIYLYSAPAAVGNTYFLPLNQNYNSLKDHERVAREMERTRPRFVLVTPDLEKDFLNEASPVGRLLRQEYRRAGVIGLAVIYEPREASP